MNMDVFLHKQLYDNSLNFKRSLDRIIGKYSKLQYQDGGIEVDLGCTKSRTLERYMKVSERELSKLESKSLTDLREESLRAQDITRNSQLDFTQQDGEADETCVSSVSTTQLSLDDGTVRSDTTQLTVSSLDESQRNLSETELQPEDQDEELEVSLRRHGRSLVELYPSMISRIEKAWRQQHVSEAADSVLRRYRRWRQQPNRSHLNNTFAVTLRHTNSNRTKTTSRTPLRENSVLPVDRQCRAEPTSWPPNLQGWQAQQQQSPGRVRALQRREQLQSVLVMDLSGPSQTFTPKEISLNETFTVSPEEPEPEEQPSTYTVSPSRLCYPTMKPSLDLSLRSKRLSGGGCSMNASQTTAVKERPDIYGSPVRLSPLKSRAMGLSRSPQAFPRSPTAYSVERFSREPVRCRSLSTSLSSPQRKPAVPVRPVCPPDSHHPFQQQQPPSRHRLRRHLSFDSSLPSVRVSYSPKKLDEDFIKLYHKFVCQNKSSFFNRLPCRFCARSSEAGKSQSSSALAALALSPHCSVLRKRHRELGWDSHPQSKRSRDEYCTSSPGSKRHGTEMLRRRLALSELERCHDGLSYSPRKHSVFQRLGTQQRSAAAHQNTWMSPSRHASGAELSGLGSSPEGKMARGSSPRKWW